MKNSLVALLIMMGLVGGMFIAGCGGGEQEPTEKPTDTSVQDAAKAMQDAAEETGEAVEEAAEEMKEGAEGSQTQ